MSNEKDHLPEELQSSIVIESIDFRHDGIVIPPTEELSRIADEPSIDSTEEPELSEEELAWQKIREARELAEKASKTIAEQKAQQGNIGVQKASA